MASKTDYQVASLAAGFTLGFGFLTVWEAIKQTRRNKNPARSTYIYMIWGEIAANLGIGILAWLLLDGNLKPTVPALFFILVCWVFEIQLLMQIIINRISVIAESQGTIRRVKWATAVVITLINIAVFCIFIPAHTIPPASETYVKINKYWDRISKVLILLVDAGLNWYFLRIVKFRLLSKHGLVKYKPLVAFNTKLMVLSVAMDALLIGSMSYPNQLVFTQFHPVTYMVKLNIEMSMASLIAHLAGVQNTQGFSSVSDPRNRRSHLASFGNHRHNTDPESLRRDSIELTPSADEDLRKIQGGAGGIHRRFDVEIRVDSTQSTPSNEGRSDDEASGNRPCNGDDEAPLTDGLGSRRVRSLSGSTWDATAIAGKPRGGGERYNDNGSPRR